MTRDSRLMNLIFTMNITALVLFLSGALFSAWAVGIDPVLMPEDAHVTGPALVGTLIVVEGPPGTFTATVTGTCKNLDNRTFSLNATDLAVAGNFAAATAKEVETFVEGFYLVETLLVGNVTACFVPTQLPDIIGLTVNTVPRVFLKNATTFVAEIILLPVVLPIR